jgi:hypothetical protein
MAINLGKLEAARKALNAVQISPRRWMYWDDGMGCYYAVSGSALAEYADFMGMVDGYSHWCAATVARKMSAG